MYKQKVKGIKNKNIAQSLAEQALKSVHTAIKKGNVTVADDEKQLPLNNQDNSAQFNGHLSGIRHTAAEARQQQNLHTILKKKKMLQEQLERVKYDEVVAKDKIVHPMKQSLQGKTKYFRSTITSDEKNKINKIIKQTKKFEAQSTKKTEELDLRIKKQKQSQKKIRQQEQRLKHERKKKEVDEKLREIMNRKQERTREINQANRQFQRVSKLTFLHQSIQQKWRIIQKSQQQENEKLFQKNREEKKFKIQQIKQHARRYSDIVNSFKQQRQQKSQRVKQDLMRHSRMVQHSHSTFFKTLNMQQSQRRQLMAQKLKQSQKLNQKKQMYAQTVRQKHKQNFNEKSSKTCQLPVNNTDIRTSKSLDNLGLNKLGNQYMKQIHSCIQQASLSQVKASSPNNNRMSLLQSSKYPDYLTKARLSRRQKNPEQLEPMQIKQLKTIIKKKNEGKQIKFEKAQRIVAKLQQKSSTSSKHMINAIIAKLSLIQEFADPK